jgi:uncharacterized protein YdaU (DUF1376 family)
MTKGPEWMPLNVGDYLKDTHYLSVVEHGAYLLLIMHYWQDGGLPADEQMVARLAHLTAEQWSESRSVLVALFDEGWKHKRIDAELAKAAEIIEKRRSAAGQRHSKSNAHAEQTESTSTYTRVPPSPSTLVIEPPASTTEPGARVSFDEVWKTYPHHPQSSEAEAEAAFNATKASERPALLAAALRFRQWFTEDNAERGRTEDAGARYVKPLEAWIKSGKWREAEKLPVKSDQEQPSPDLVVIRENTPEFDAIKRFRNGKAPVVGKNGTTTVRKAELEQAGVAA